MPSRTRIGIPGPFVIRSTSDNSARIPPSPSLSARRTRTTYLSDTIAISAQKMREMIPRTSTVGRGRMASGAQRDGKGIERARPDIAEHDADRSEREEPGIALMVQFAAWDG